MSEWSPRMSSGPEIARAATLSTIGTRVPMVLNVAARAISGPLDIRGDHSDIYYALNTGWIMLCARDPQAVYDLNFAAIKIGEHADVRLPVLVAYDGFITSHQKRRIPVFDDTEA